MTYTVQDVLHWTIYCIMEGDLSIKAAYDHAVSYLVDSPEDTVPSYEEVDDALEKRYEALVSKHNSDERLTDEEEQEFQCLMRALIEGN